MKRTIVGVCVTLALTACGGGASGAPSSSPSTASGPVVQPQSISFTTQAGQQTKVSVSGGTPPYTLKAGDARLISLSSTAVASSGGIFTVSPVASGSTTVTIADAKGDSAAVAVDTPVCTPPVPSLLLAYPPPSASGVGASQAQIWVADSTADPGLKYIATYALRLLGSNGSAIQGGNLQTTASSPPSGSASPPPGGLTYTYATSSLV